MKILSADYVLPISSEPIIGGAVVIDKAKIVAVGAANRRETSKSAAGIWKKCAAIIVAFRRRAR